jgi:non-ribosomal peptide synthetase-like protein
MANLLSRFVHLTALAIYREKTMEQEQVIESSSASVAVHTGFVPSGPGAGPRRFADLQTYEAGCLHELFERQVDRSPQAPALIAEGLLLSYAELDARANRLARYLRSHGVRAGSFVGLFMERSAAPIIGILACLKAGAAYVPIDPSYPADRIRGILDETEAVAVLSGGSLAARVSEFFSGRCVDVDRDAQAIAAQPVGRLLRAETGVSPADICYLIYTSGTTGKPKGVMAEHHHVVRFALAFNEVCATGPEDRVYQGFSLGFDGSVEELWMAFSNGSALVVGTPSTPRFGDELAQFLAEQRVSYLSTVPTLLSTMHRDIPSLRWLVVSGEVCPPELVSRWARPGLTMLNVYGPTEATVNTTAAICRPGANVTIGRELPGYRLYILDEAQRPVPPGEKGELYVAGETLARGYFKRPDLTAERFVEIAGLLPDPSQPLRLYRTGDLVRRSDDGELEFFGRIDSQVKIRGYRVELAEIETVLLQHPQVRSASVKLCSRDGLQELAAYVLLRDGADTLDRGSVLAELEARLPPYMIPGHLDVLPEFPLLASGKVDRARLPLPSSPLVRVHDQQDFVAPQSELEATIAAIWARVFGVAKVSTDDDFFHDLGGHSLIAAQMVTQLRAETQGLLGQAVTVRDAYRFPTVQALAAHLEPSLIRAGADAAEVRSVGTGPAERVGSSDRAPSSSREVRAAQSPLTRFATGLAQLISTYLIYGVASIPFAVFFLFARGWLFGSVSTAQLAQVILGLTLCTWPVFMAIAIAAKWLIVGRYREGSFPLWGSYHLRTWLVGRLAALSGAGALVGTPLLPIYLRLMGARVGRGCTLDSALIGAWDLIDIGDDTSIGADTQLLGYRVEGGLLHIGGVTVGRGCFIGNHSALGLGTRMGDHARLDDQSLLPDGHAVPAGESYRGSPALPGPVTLSADAIGPEPQRRPVLYGFLHLALVQVLSLMSLLPLLPLLSALWAMLLWMQREPLSAVGLWLVLAGPVGVVIACAYIVVLKKIVLSRLEPGLYPVHSPLYLRKWLSDGIMRSSRATLLPLYTTMFLPPYLRLLGAKIGPRAELSSIWYFAPELTEIAAESFFADGSIVGGKRVFGGRFEVGRNRIGRRSFVGNSAILPTGTGLGDRCLLGVNSIPPVTPGAQGTSTPDGTEWLGSPAFSLPRRPVVGNFDESLTFQPTPKLYAQRAVIDGLRILIPSYIGLFSGVAGLLAMNAAYVRYGLAGMLLLSPLITLSLALLATLIVVALKWLVMGTFKPIIKPLWSPYVWLNEMVNGAYESVMAPAIAPFLGTPFIAFFLRLLGCEIGKGCYIETTLFSEFDLVKIGDYAALNLGAVIQNHLFEDRVMKSSYLKIGDECSVGNMAVVLYDSEMGARSMLGSLSLLMKGESLAEGTRWHGIPCMPCMPPRPATEAAPDSARLPAAVAS